MNSEIEYKRYIKLKFPDYVGLEKKTVFHIYISTKQSSSADEILLPIKSDKTSLLINIVIQCENFEIIGNDHKQIQVNLEEIESPRVVFEIRAKREGMQNIMIMFSSDGKLLHTKETRVYVRSKQITIMVLNTEREYTLIYNAGENTNPEKGMVPLKDRDPTNKFQEFIKEIEKEQTLPESTAKRTMEANGITLYNKFIPSNIKKDIGI